MSQFDIHDLFVFVGLGLMAYGLWLIYPPAMFIIMGILMIMTGLRTGNN